MTTVTWNDALQGVSPITGGQPLPPATYRFRPVAGVGKINSSQGVMLELELEVVSGPLQGRKAFHNENLPKGNTDQDKTRMGFFLGLCEAFGITGAMLGQMFGGQPITKESIDYLAQYLVQQGQVIKGTVRPQKNDASRINIGNWTPDDGIEPEPPVQKPVQAGPPQGQFGPPTTPNGAVPGPGGFVPPSGPPQVGQGGFPQAPSAQQGSGLPLGGFPGSGGMQPNPAPDWATQQLVQGQAPQQLQGPGQMAPAAQPQAAGMNQFAQPQAAQFPQMGQQPQQAMQEGFPGQQFPGQVNPVAFPPPGQAPQGGFQPPAGLPGQMPPGQPQQAPAGLPQGGFPPVGQGQPPQANI